MFFCFIDMIVSFSFCDVTFFYEHWIYHLYKMILLTKEYLITFCFGIIVRTFPFKHFCVKCLPSMLTGFWYFIQV